MTPKEKAYDILNKMTCGEGYKNIGSGWSAMLPNNKFYIMCAYIAVNELIYFGNTELLSEIFEGDFYCDVDFFEAVKKEIEKL